MLKKKCFETLILKTVTIFLEYRTRDLNSQLYFDKRQKKLSLSEHISAANGYQRVEITDQHIQCVFLQEKMDVLTNQ